MWNKSNKWLGIAWLFIAAMLTLTFVDDLVMNRQPTYDDFVIVLLSWLVGILFLSLYREQRPFVIHCMGNIRCYHARCRTKRNVIDVRAWPVEDEAKDDTT